MRSRVLLLCAAMLALGVEFGVAETTPAKPKSAIAIKSAKRGEKYTKGTGLEPNAKTDCVLVVELGGISPEEFQAIGKDAIYVKIGDEKRNFQVKSSGSVYQLDAAGNRIGGGPKIVLAGVVPRDAKEYSVVVADQTLAVPAPTPILSEVSD